MAELLKGPQIITDILDEDVLYIGTRVYKEKNGIRRCEEKYRYPISKDQMDNIVARVLYSKMKKCETGYEQEYYTPNGKFKITVEWIEKQ
jgi:hypothetical protein